MAVPKRKTSRSKKGKRRSHHALGKPNLRPCPHCGEYGLPHRVCPECGYYKGRQVIIPKVKISKKEKESA
ncbi:MAG: 50S ribosomal protein L32 [Candidatus Hydrogenedentota bacterium]|nr:MAG: 50S ribosomal protein L32 [Candidatus Hydrogenedentota bacterium]